MKITVDIDQTLLYTEYDEFYGYTVKSINKKLIKQINKLFDEGHTIIIWTGRHWNHLTQTKHQLDFFDIKYTTLLMAKPACDIYIDDKAVTPEKFLNEVDKERGENIKKVYWHDAGAYGKCSYCGRYSDNSECLDSDYKCDCGKKNGYSGSFKTPNKNSIWDK